jgi:hypothetical protein
MKASTESMQEIERLDELLGVCRESWLDSPKDKKKTWLKRINDILDKRIIAMQHRDSVQHSHNI